MAYRAMVILVTLSGFQGRLPIASLFKWDFCTDAWSLCSSWACCVIQFPERCMLLCPSR